MKRKSQEYHLILPERYKPSLSEMVLVFTIASIVGYFVETGYVFLSVGKVVKRGMLIGPYCPIYGFGALILYLCFYRVTAKKGNIPLIFISASLILGSFELLCGLAFKYILNIEMWNYYGKPLNILNYTTVPILIGWGILGTIYVFFVHPIILKIVSFILGDHFNLYGIWFAVIVAICISALNVILDMTLFKRLTFKEE